MGCRLRNTIAIAALALAPATLCAAEPSTAGQTIRLDETVISGNQELPKVLYILPWQTPEGMPELEVRADLAEGEIFRRLYPPAYRRELKYFETLDRIQSEE